VLVREQPGVRHPRKEVLEAVSGALEEIEASFEMMGFSSGKGQAFLGEAPKVQPVEEEYDETYGDEYGEDEGNGGVEIFQREDVEVAIDVFLSRLVQERVIKKYKRNKQPSLEGVFEHIFGENHEIIKPVQVFEEHIEGYFDLIGFEDMELAFGELADIRRIIDKELDRYAVE
jgi:hypothetical protein